MLALIDNALFHCEPSLEYRGGFSIEATPPNVKRRGQVLVRAGRDIIRSGVTFFRMKGEGTIDPRTGDYQLKGRGKSVFRAVFNGQHLEIEL